MNDKTPKAIWDIRVAKYERKVAFWKSLQKFDGEDGMPLGKEDTHEGLEHDNKVCKKIIEDMLQEKERGEDKIVKFYVRFRINGHGTKGETAYLQITMENESVIIRAAYYPTEVEQFFSREGDPLELSEEKFKEIGIGHKINKRVLRFKTIIEEEFRKRMK